MLTLSKFARGRQTYFLDAVASGGNTNNRLIEAEGSWLGHAIKDLSADCPLITDEALVRLFDGRHPASGEVLNAHHDRVRIAGFDCVFAAPKSVSVLYGLSAPEDAAKILQAHTSAVDATLDYLERHASFVNRSSHGVQHAVPATGFVAAAFVHRTSRTLDPHLHTHVLVTNLAQGRDAKWSAMDARGLYDELSAARHLYGAQLRYEMSRQFNVQWRLSKSGFGDIDGMPRTVLAAFATRSSLIATERERLVVEGSQHGRLLGDVTRPEKRSDIAYDELVEMWRDRGFRHGLSNAHISDLLSPRIATSERSDEQLLSSFDAIDGRFSRSDLTKQVASRAMTTDIVAIERIVDSALASPAVVRGKNAHVAELGKSARKYLPLGREIAMYETKSSVDRQTRIVDRFSTARSFAANDLVRGVVNAETIAALPNEHIVRLIADDRGVETAVYDALVALDRSATPLHLTVRCVAPNDARGAHFEALTGIATVGAADFASVTPNDLVVIESPERMTKRDLERVLDRASSFGRPVLTVDMPSFVVDERINHAPIEPSRRFDGERAMAGDVAVNFVGSPNEMRMALAMIAAEQNGPVIAVSVSRALVSDFALHASTPREVDQLLKITPQAHVVVVGGTRVLGTALGSVRDDQRSHVVVRGNNSSSLVERAIEIAEPKEVRRSLGRIPASFNQREQWTKEATSLTRNSRLHELVDTIRNDRSMPSRRSAHREMSRPGRAR